MAKRDLRQVGLGDLEADAGRKKPRHAATAQAGTRGDPKFTEQASGRTTAARRRRPTNQPTNEQARTTERTNENNKKHKNKQPTNDQRKNGTEQKGQNTRSQRTKLRKKHAVRGRTRPTSVARGQTNALTAKRFVAGRFFWLLAAENRQSKTKDASSESLRGRGRRRRRSINRPQTNKRPSDRANEHATQQAREPSSKQ